MNNQPENIKGMRTKIKAQQDHIRNLEKIIADSRIAPLPPAGDVEVLLDSVIDEISRRFDLSKRDEDHMVCDDTQIGVEFAIKALRPALTSLTAERDEIRAIKDSAIESVALLHAERAGLMVEVEHYSQKIDRMQSELTKARELLIRLRNCKWIPTAEWQHEVSEVIAHQSAPAAKGGA